jgi:hypothetical protein
VLLGDVVVASGAYAFADKTAGTGKTVTASGVALSGADAGNYVVASTSTDTADILKMHLTDVFTADDKIYDGTAAATGSIGLLGVVAGDTSRPRGPTPSPTRTSGGIRASRPQTWPCRAPTPATTA